MKKYSALFLGIICILGLFLHSNPVKSEAKFVSGYSDGLVSTYAIIEFNGTKYKTDETGSRINQKLWSELNDDDKRKLMKYYWSPNNRNADFGVGSSEMASWANDDQGWTGLIEALKQKRANKNYPDLKAFYEKEPEFPQMPNVACTEQIQNCDLAKEAIELQKEIQGNYYAGREVYQKLVNVKWEQVGVAVKGISANLIPIIVDNFMTAHITNGASQMSQLLATLYQFADQTKDFAKNNPNDAAELIKKLDTLCDMMETDATTAKNFVEKDSQKLQSIYEQLAKLCEEDIKNKQKAEEQKQAALKALMQTKIAETGLIITSTEKEPEDREAEIAKQASNIYFSLNSSMSSEIKSAREDYASLVSTHNSLKNPTPVNMCNGQYPDGPDSYCFKMYYSVDEITEWQNDFPRAISEIKEKLEKDKSLKQSANEARAEHAEKIKSIQSRINELVSKYKKYLPYARVENDIESKLEYYNQLIDNLDKEIPNLELALSQEENAEKYTKEGLKKRIERERNEARPYTSLEANFVNSLSQIKDAVYTLDKKYEAEELITLNKKIHKPSINTAKLKEVKTKISLLPTQAEQDRETKIIVDRLKELEKEENHQIKRLIIGQNNAMYDYQELSNFLDYYTEGLVHTITAFEKVKQDVQKVANVSLKDPYYDIVKDWQGSDYMLWMLGSGSSLRWELNADSMRLDIDLLIEQLDGKNQFYNSLNEILKEIQANKNTLLAMNGDSFRKKYNEYSASSYKIVQEATSNGEDNKQVSKNYVNILNLLSEINGVIITRERVKDALPILTQDIKDAKALLANTNAESWAYEEMNSKLKQDTKEGSEAYYAKEDPALVPLFKEIADLILKLQDMQNKSKMDKNTYNTQKIYDFYSSFKMAYESKIESQVVNLISNDWGSADGTTISDLEDNLRRIFNIFNNMTYNISNLTITPVSDNIYRASYDVEIVGVNYEKNLTHKEKSSVIEEVIIDNKGRIKINKTIAGRFWYIE